MRGSSGAPQPSPRHSTMNEQRSHPRVLRLPCCLARPRCVDASSAQCHGRSSTDRLARVPASHLYPQQHVSRFLRCALCAQFVRKGIQIFCLAWTPDRPARSRTAGAPTFSFDHCALDLSGSPPYEMHHAGDHFNHLREGSSSKQSLRGVVIFTRIVDCIGSAAQTCTATC